MNTPVIGTIQQLTNLPTFNQGETRMKNGIILHLVIPCDEVFRFLGGETVRAWPIYPCPEAPIWDNSADQERYFPKGATIIEVDLDEVSIGQYSSGVFIIQRKGSSISMPFDSTLVRVKPKATRAPKESAEQRSERIRKIFTMKRESAKPKPKKRRPRENDLEA